MTAGVHRILLVLVPLLLFVAVSNKEQIYELTYLATRRISSATHR